MSEEKTHYRKVFKSDHLGAPDLEEMLEDGKSLVFTIKHVKQEINVRVAGSSGNFNIAYFVEGIKPLVLNSTNSKQVSKFAKSPFVEDWNNVKIELYIDEKVKFGKEIVQGVRIKHLQPKDDKPLPTFTEANFEKAKQNGATVEQIKKYYTLSLEIEKQYIDYVK